MNLQHLADRRHERALELAASAIDVDLTTIESGELGAHLATCPACARRAAAMRADASSLGRPIAILPSRRVDAAVYTEIARPRAGSQRLLLLAAAALLLVALLGAVAGGAYLLRTWQTLPTTLVPPPTVPVADTSPRPDASPAVAGETWQTFDIERGSSGGLIEAVTFAGTGLVGVGHVGCAGDPVDDPTGCYGAAWTAEPGGTWTRVPDQDGLLVGPGVALSGSEKGLYDVAMGPAGLVAVGYAYDAAGVIGPRVWRSPDGRTWEPSAYGFGPSSGIAGPRVAAIAASQDVYVIVGSVIEGSTARAHAAAWVSTDGIEWSRAPDADLMDVGPCLGADRDSSTCGAMLDVTPTGSGFVAVGQARSGAGDRSRPAAWTSPDGITWTRADAGLDFEGQLSGVVAGGPGLVAVGATCLPACPNVPTMVGVAATSRDGSVWESHPMMGATVLHDVAFAGGRAFALGTLEGAPATDGIQLWRSDDGVGWSRVSSLPSVAGATSYGGIDLAAADDRLVIVGWADVAETPERRNFAYVSPPGRSSVPPNEGPQPTPTPALAATPSPIDSIATAVDPVVVLRVDMLGDVGMHRRVRLLTVYRDGTVLRRDDAVGRVTKLTPVGLNLLLAPATDSGLFALSGDIPPDPGYDAGFVTYTIDLLRDQGIVHRSTTNVLLTPATRAESERLIALAERLANLETWLPASAWATGPAAAEPYVASHYLLKVTSFKQPGVTYPPQAMDRADVVWPLAGQIEGYGELADEQPFGPGTASWCGPLTLAEAVAVRHALAAAPVVQMGERLQADLDWAPDVGHITISLAPLRPEDPVDCAVDLGWP